MCAATHGHTPKSSREVRHNDKDSRQHAIGELTLSIAPSPGCPFVSSSGAIASIPQATLCVRGHGARKTGAALSFLSTRTNTFQNRRELK